MLKRMAFVLLTLVPFCRGDDQYSKTDTRSWDFAPAGQVEIHVRCGGDVHIVPADDSRVVITYTMHSNHADFISKVEPQFEVKGAKAALTLKAPHDGSVEVELKVPARTDIYLRLEAGDIRLGPIQGNKDLETHAGDIEVELVDPASYGVVDASTHAGDVVAPFGKPHGWIGNSLNYQGAGAYRIHAHTFAGDITLHEAKSAESAPTGPEADDFEASLKKILDDYSAGYGKKDANQVANLYVEDALYVGATGRVEGRKAIRDSLAGQFLNASDMELSIHSVKCEHSADMGYDYGTYKAGSAADAEMGKYVLVFRKVKGTWLIAVASATPGAE
jgi:ketosteroid isomerase-like protein